MDRSKWQRGPWDSELDQLGWVDQATGYQCAIVRTDIGHLCGYVGIPEGHPLHGIGYGAPITKQPQRHLFDGWYQVEHDWDTAGGLFSVHGGITYSGGAYWTDNSGHWYGFDCGHCNDIAPGITYRNGAFMDGAVYRDMNYVKAECASLAKQLHQIASKGA